MMHALLSLRILLQIKERCIDKRGDSLSQKVAADVMGISVCSAQPIDRGELQPEGQWQRVSPGRECYFYTYQATIWKVTPGDWKTDALIDFVFQNKPQDIDRFRNAPYWRERFGTDLKEHRRFRWARF